MRILCFDRAEDAKLRMHELMEEVFGDSSSPVQVVMMEGQMNIISMTRQELDSFIYQNWERTNIRIS